MPKVVLLKIFEDVKIRYTARTARGSYLQEFEVVKRPNPEPITLEKLAEYVTNLNQRFPDREFYLDEKVIDGKKFIVLSQKRRPEKKIKELEKEIAKAREEREAILTEIIGLGKVIEAVKQKRREIIKKLRWIDECFPPIKLLLKPLEKYLRRKDRPLRRKLRELGKRYKQLSELEAKLTEKIKTLLEELEKIQRKGIDGVIPLYFDLENQEVYIPKTVWEKKRKNAAFIIHRCLGALGLATTRYVRTVGRVVKP